MGAFQDLGMVGAGWAGGVSQVGTGWAGGEGGSQVGAAHETGSALEFWLQPVDGGH